MAQLRAVLSTPQVPHLLAFALVGRLPTAMSALAVLLLVRGQGGTYTLAGGLAALLTAGTAVGQPLLARVVDRRGQPAVLVLAALVSSVAFVVLALAGVGHVGVSAVAAAVAGLGTPPLEPCLRALWPDVVGTGPRLQAAFSLDVGAQEVVYVVGPLLATAGVALLGDAGGVLACVLFGAAGTLAFVALRAPRDWRPTPHEGRRGTPLRHPVLVRLFVATLACGVPVGALAVVAAAYAGGRHSTVLTGWALAANAAGALVAGLYGAAHSEAEPPRLALAAAALAGGYVPLALPLPPVAWLPLAALSGLALPVVLTAVFSTVQRLCPPALLTEANAWVATAFGLGAAGAASVAGVVTDRFTADVAVAAVVLGAAAAAAVASLLTGRVGSG
ncbi:Major Facilitator Superfamily protein [Jatrophihabitans endophyticus]|uniref:Major Facilitator Superfamily protein n=2 Tax=Jatrophihabitans endophyticus TaxID=1206085 RepID=A0A1M5MZL2_9ACTN|nr:Major Facilitator Superfamily protein [Jatrophihabitans endophyticus]